jgi:hypothetical protein
MCRHQRRPRTRTASWLEKDLELPSMADPKIFSVVSISRVVDPD